MTEPNMLVLGKIINSEVRPWSSVEPCHHYHTRVFYFSINSTLWSILFHFPGIKSGNLPLLFINKLEIKMSNLLINNTLHLNVAECLGMPDISYIKAAINNRPLIRDSFYLYVQGKKKNDRETRKHKFLHPYWKHWLETPWVPWDRLQPPCDPV